MFIQTEQTPNPATLKFLPGRAVMAAGTANFTDARVGAARSPLAERLFTVPRRHRRVPRRRFRHREQGRATATGTS